MTAEIIATKREKPILFNGDMVRAILDGRKTQTRRVVKGLALEWLEEDAKAEGAMPIQCDYIRRSCEDIGCYGDTAKASFRGIWESTGGDWSANPWVWVIEFKRVEVAV
jgi:hypothetical protein